MARIIGVDIPRNKRVVISLTYIRGIGRKSAQKILKDVGDIDLNTRVKDLTAQQIIAIRNQIQKSNYLVEGNLTRTLKLNINRLMEINCWRGLRHRRGLPVRGQNTRNNARTVKGKRRIKSTISNKKK